MSLIDTILAFLSSNAEEFIVVVAGSIVAGLILAQLLRSLEKPKFSFQAVQDGAKLGFQISIKKKMIKDARIRCNNVSYSWEDGNKKTEKKDLFAGDTPSSFFPYEITWQYSTGLPHPIRLLLIRDKKRSEEIGMQVTIYETSKKTEVFKEYFLIYGDQFLMQPEQKKRLTFEPSIRLIGEGVDEVKDYSLKIGLKNLSYPEIKGGKFTSNQIWATFELKKKHIFW